MFKMNFTRWVANSRDFSKVDVVIAVNTQQQKNEIEKDFPNIDIKVIGENLGVCKPIYEITKDLQGDDSDILIGIFDDVNCIPQWDEFLLSKFENYSGALLINDGIQIPDENAVLIAITMPVMDLATLKKLNRVIYHPEYKHYFADNEIHINLMDLGLLKDIRFEDSTVFQHEHYSIVHKRKLDEVDNEIISQCGNYDRAVFEKRMKLPLDKRLEV
jgi:hypothetical protein